jgi:hypothetical protein
MQAAKADKLLNQVVFIKDQMQELVVKFENAALFEEADELDRVIHSYSLFLEKAKGKLNSE